MRKKLIAFCILIVVIISIYIIFTLLTVKIPFSTSDESIIAIEICTPGVESVYTKEKSKILEVIKYINNCRYYKKSNWKQATNDTPDAFIRMVNKDGKIIDKIIFYGDVVEYKDKQYGLTPFTYRGLEKLCNRLNSK